MVFISCFLIGCDELKTDVQFSETIKGRKINLSKKIGNNFQIIRESDTLKYSVSFDKSKSINYIIKSDFDTIFEGTITKRNELFLLNRVLKNGNFSIHALKFTDSTITGLETEWIQSKMLKSESRNSDYSESIIDSTDSFLINLNKSDGKSIFRKIIAKLEPEKRVRKLKKYSNIQPIEDSSKFNKKVDNNSQINKVYPNPFDDKITIILNEKAPYIFKIFDLNGQLIKTTKLNTAEITIELNNLNSKTYILKVYNSDNKFMDDFKLFRR